MMPSANVASISFRTSSTPSSCALICIRAFDAAVIASTERRDAAEAGEYRQAEISRRRSNVMRAPVEDDFVKALTAATDQFIVARGGQKTVIAGYHWFNDWGRDTMIPCPASLFL